jgi:putative transposase
LIRTYTYKLYNSKTVERKFNQWIGVCRYVYNIAKETKETAYQSGVNLSGYDLAKQLTEAKKSFDFLGKVHSQTLQGVIEQLDTSYKNFFRNHKNGTIKKLQAQYLSKCSKNGREVNWKHYYSIGKPKWAAKKDWNSFGFKNTNNSLRQTEKGFKLPGFGSVKVFNNRPITGTIKTARLVQKADGIYLHVTAEVQDTYNTNESQVGIDMGIKYFLVTSDGEFIDNPKFLQKQSKKLRVEQRKLSRKYKKGKEQSKNYYKQVKVVARLHKKVVDARKDFLHKTSTYLARNYGTVVHEDLKITEMVKSKYSKHISDVSWGLFFELLSYKTNVIKVNPAYTSQTCSCCGHTAKENRVTQSIFKCVSCGHEQNADSNAAENILKAGTSAIDVNVNH